MGRNRFEIKGLIAYIKKKMCHSKSGVSFLIRMFLIQMGGGVCHVISHTLYHIVYDTIKHINIL